MEVILILIAVSLVLAGAFLVVFLWASKTGQFEDTTTPALRILTEDPPPAVPASASMSAPAAKHAIRSFSPPPSNPTTS